MLKIYYKKRTPETSGNRLIFKRGILYFMYILCFGYILREGLILQEYLQDRAVKTMNYLGFSIYYTLFPIMLGVFLALPELYKKIKKSGIWKIDWVKIVAVGLPTLPIACYMWIGVLPLSCQQTHQILIGILLLTMVGKQLLKHLSIQITILLPIQMVIPIILLFLV